MTPRVSVLLPVFNGARYLPGAIESILGQTYTDFELLIIDDGSSDDSIEVVRSYSDDRIFLYSNGFNEGLVKALNRGISLSRGEFVARMDCDDISHPRRLAEQVSFMDTHPRVALCGTWVKTFGARAVTVRHFANDEEIRAGLVFESQLAHPSVMIRKEVLDTHGLHYDENYPSAEDYALWSAISTEYRLANVEKVLLFYRVHCRQVTAINKLESKKSAAMVSRRQLERLGLHPTEEEEALHGEISARVDVSSRKFVAAAESWLCQLDAANAERRAFEKQAFRRILGRYWWETCFHATGLGFHAWKLFHSSILHKYSKISAKYMIFFFIKCAVKYRKIEPVGQ